MAAKYDDRGFKLNQGTMGGTGGTNLTANGYPSSSSGYVTTGSNNAPKYNQGISRGTTTNNGARSLSGSDSGSGSGGSSAGGTGGGIDYSALLGAYGSRQSDYEAYLAQMRAAAQEAYDRSMNALNTAYDKHLASLSSNLDSTKGQLLDSYNRSKTNVNSDAEASLRQAYINNMMNQKNLGQKMSAQGLTGGATESSLASILNQYGNARNDINTTRNKNLSSLEGNYNDNLAQVVQAYNSAVANAELQKAQQAMSLENALANNQISALSDYYSLMQSNNDSYLDLLKTAIANGAKFNFNPTSANNAVQAVNTTQAAPMSSNTNYAALQALQNAQNAAQNNSALTVANPVSLQDYINAIWSQMVRG